jgi:hypothetical protein
VALTTLSDYWDETQFEQLNHLCYAAAIRFPSQESRTFIYHYFAVLQEPEYDFQAPHLEYLAQQIEICTKRHANAIRHTFIRQVTAHLTTDFLAYTHQQYLASSS